MLNVTPMFLRPPIPEEKLSFPPAGSKHPDNPIVTELGRSITLKKLIESLKKGSKIGEKLFVSSSNYGQSYLLKR